MHAHTLPLASAAVGLLLLVSACGGSSVPRIGAQTGGDQKKLAFALKVARCMRSHGFPTYPDPPNASPSSQGSGTRFDGTGINPKSPHFQTAETNCEKLERKALGLT